jgi:hypothetical protein
MFLSSVSDDDDDDDVDEIFQCHAPVVGEDGSTQCPKKPGIAPSNRKQHNQAVVKWKT